jgi:hypothetical protein
VNNFNRFVIIILLTLLSIFYLVLAIYILTIKTEKIFNDEIKNKIFEGPKGTIIEFKVDENDVRNHNVPCYRIYDKE